MYIDSILPETHDTGKYYADTHTLSKPHALGSATDSSADSSP